MKLLLDPQAFNMQQFGGISRYHAAVMAELLKMPDVEMELPLVYSENAYLIGSGAMSGYRNRLARHPLVPRFVRKRLVRRFKEENLDLARKALLRQDFDVFVTSYYDPYFLDCIGEKPFVLTLHDMIHDIYPQYFGDDSVTIARKRLLLEKAARVICVSNNTRKDVLSFYPDLDPEKFSVIHLSHSIDAMSAAAIALPSRYVLYVGNRAAYKNFGYFIESVAPLLAADRELFVVCAGGHGLEKSERALLKNLGIDGQVVQRSFKDEELGDFYARARCFVFPSEYEGFGIPILEAMACGCPVILSNRSSFPEVAGDSAVFFELNDSQDLRGKVAALLSDDALRETFVQRGLRRAAEFSWRRTALGCLEVYRQAAVGRAARSPFKGQ
jgi:glycosyltransferase involved in cell wall biosynthesis